MPDDPRPFVVPPGRRASIVGPVGGPATILARAEETGDPSDEPREPDPKPGETRPSEPSGAISPLGFTATK